MSERQRLHETALIAAHLLPQSKFRLRGLQDDSRAQPRRRITREDLLQQASQIGLVHTVAERQAAQLQELVVVDERVTLRLGAIAAGTANLQSGERQDEERDT